MLAQLAGRQRGVIASRQLIHLGFTPREITVQREQARLHELHLGIYAVGHGWVSLEGQWIAAALAAGPQALLSHRDALFNWGVADYRLSEIEVTLEGLGSRRRPGLRIHRTRFLDPADRAVHRGVPVTSLARTLVDVAGSISPRHLREAYLEAGRRELLDFDDLRRVVSASGRRKGIGNLRRLLAEDTTRHFKTKSPFESGLLDFCRNHGIPDPLPNAWLHGFEVDAYWPSARLAVELDSWEFHRGRGAFEKDRAKIGDLRLFGIEVLPVTHRRLHREPEKLAGIIRKALADRS